MKHTIPTSDSKVVASKATNLVGANAAGGKRPAKRRHSTVQLISAVVLCAIGASLLILGFYAPPMGEIHSSVLVAYGETLTFAGACFGIDYYHRYKPK